ncbi:4069_t:CDS:1, partial [Gigaspora rosea]
MSPYPPAPVDNVFTVSGNFHLESGWLDILFERHGQIDLQIANMCSNMTGCDLCGVVDGCPSENNSFKTVIKFNLKSPSVLSGPYLLKVRVFNSNTPMF